MKKYIYFWTALLLYICSCKPYEPRGYRKLSDHEMIERARIGDFPNLKNLVYMNLKGQVITRDSLIKIEPFDELAFDDYVDSFGIVRITIVRQATPKDKKLREKINAAITEGPILKSIQIECSNTPKLLDEAFFQDQKNREHPDSFDINIDIKNLELVTSLIDQCGMPTKQQLTERQLTTIWLIVQHAPTKYQKKYLPIFKLSAKNGDLDIRDILMMEDRILMDEGKPQVYGTQVRQIDSTGKFELYDTIDPEYINQRRSSVGFEPIEQYLLYWGIKFNIVQKKK